MSKKLPVAIQVYGLRDLLENTPENFKNVMQQVKNLGYDGVELAGLYGLEPEFVKKTLAEVGLVPISAHVAFDEMMNDLDKVIADYSAIGVKFLVMPYMAEKYRPVNPEGFAKFLPMLNEVGEKIHKAGMTFLYHNHDIEFVKLEDGRWGYDAMFEAIPHDNLMPELDTCWCDVATGDAPGFIRKYTDLITVIHLKDCIALREQETPFGVIKYDFDEYKG
jgi:sugar phosphate isomerase/epimerase